MVQEYVKPVDTILFEMLDKSMWHLLLKLVY